MGNAGANHKTHTVDIVVVGWNHLDQTRKCIKSIYGNTRNVEYDLIYVDNGSDLVPSDSGIDTTGMYGVNLPYNTGYCHGTNVGLAMSLLSDSEYVLLLNNDCEIPEGDTTWLDNLILPMRLDEKIGSVGAVSNTVFGYQRRATVNEAHRELPSVAGFTHYREAPSLIGFCQLIRKSALEQVGLLDERFDPDGNYSDYDYSIRLARAGWKMAIAESVWIHHVGSATQKDLDFSGNLRKGHRLLAEKWGSDALKSVGLAV